MANAQPGGDVSQRGPADYLDPLASVSSQFQQLQSLLALVFDDYEGFVEELTDDILATPPERRFTHSLEVLQEHVEERFGSTDAFTAVLPESNPDRIPVVVDQLIDRLLDDLLEGVFHQREPEDRLVLVALFQGIRYGMQRIEEDEELEAREQIVSSILALISRLHRDLDDSQDSISDDVTRDVAYGLHYITTGDEGPQFPYPDEVSFEESKQNVIELGAVVAYARLDISVSRGAELAGLPPQEFREVLDQYDVEPRFGPTSLGELSDGQTDE